MMTQKYNDKYTQYNDVRRLKKLGSLNLSRVFFIVSNSTASASELLINNLKPYLDVKLVGHLIVMENLLASSQYLLVIGIYFPCLSEQ
jgi:C-terminal processing protease CtpA/Prc